MTRDEVDLAALRRCCGGNEEAMGFLNLWRRYVHGIDDLIDRPGRVGAEEILRTFALAAELYSHPFYLRHIGHLRGLVFSITNAYADSVGWERSEVDWQRSWADHYRHVGAEMVLAVAFLCAGYEHMRSVSRELRIVCWHEHHTPGGKPV
jgi:hypothetical protein